MKIPPAFAAPAISAMYKLWCASLRYTEVGRDVFSPHVAQKFPLVFALWHDELFALPRLRGSLRIFCIVSRSRDGEYLSALLKGQGLDVVKGSSSRGGLSALLQAARLMKETRLHACITVDGPRGPRRQAKDGAVFLAHQAESYIVPVRVFYARAKIFNSWDKFQLPWPFSRVEVRFGEPYMVRAEKLTKESLAQERATLHERLAALEKGDV